MHLYDKLIDLLSKPLVENKEGKPRIPLRSSAIHDL